MAPQKIEIKGSTTRCQVFIIAFALSIWVSSVWPPGLNAFESIVIYDRNAQLFQSFLGQLKKILHQTVFFVPFE